MIAHILIIITVAHGGPSRSDSWPVITFQRFGNAKACQLASLEIAKRYRGADFGMVCVPEESK